MIWLISSLIFISRYYDKFGDVKQNKGAILQASVDYIQLLKDENDEFRHKDSKTQVKLQQTEQEKRKLLLRIQVFKCIYKEIFLNQNYQITKISPKN